MGAEVSSDGAPADELADGRLFLGVDIGGTTLSVSLVDGSGRFVGAPQDPLVIGAGSEGPSPVWWQPLGDDHTPRRLAECAGQLAKKALATAGRSHADMMGVGVCTPGLMDVKAGIVRAAANLKGWRDVPVCDIFADVLGVDRAIVVLENDTKAALLAEVWVGAAKGCENAVVLTLGTSVGAAMMCDGRLLRGAKGQAGEVGHYICVPEGRTWGTTGVDGILEAYGSCRAVAHRAIENGGPPRSSTLFGNQDNGDAAPPECKDVFEHAKRGDQFALGIIHETARLLAISCINCCRFVDPEVILFAGGMTNSGELLLEEVRKQFVAHHWNIEPVSVRLAIASAGAHAGVLGAARASMLRVEG